MPGSKGRGKGGEKFRVERENHSKKDLKGRWGWRCAKKGRKEGGKEKLGGGGVKGKKHTGMRRGKNVSRPVSHQGAGMKSKITYLKIDLNCSQIRGTATGTGRKETKMGGGGKTVPFGRKRSTQDKTKKGK